MKNIIIISFAFCFTIFLFSCGDMFAFKKNIYGNYYLIEGDAENDISLDYKVTDGGFVQRVPARVIEYTVVVDSFIVAKSKQGTKISYYVLNIKKDSIYADAKSYLIGPLKQNDFYNWWKRPKEDLKFLKVK